MPDKYLGTFSFMCINCFNSWSRTGYSDENEKAICSQCGNEVKGEFRMLDPSEDIDAT
jgi:rRNA maturation endonuclease Nob1